jgi:hypothetical protein
VQLVQQVPALLALLALVLRVPEQHQELERF